MSQLARREHASPHCTQFAPEPNNPAANRGVQVALRTLIAVDLLVFAYDFHPRAQLRSLAPNLAAGASRPSP